MKGPIESTMGICSNLSHKRNGQAISAQGECKIPAEHLVLGDVTVTILDVTTHDDEDQDHTSDATLHRCTD
jgi:hypothetical protein